MIKYFSICSFVLSFMHPPFCHADFSLEESLQLIVVTSNGWDTKQGYLQYFEREHSQETWKAKSNILSVMLGKAGMGIGIGLYPLDRKEYPVKKEGDLKAPAGIFKLGQVFGFAPLLQMQHLKMDYLPLSESTYAVDDNASHYYNQIVDSKETAIDWNSSEEMGKEPLYEMGLVVHHNFPACESGKGSAIFLHLWRSPNSGTAGCTTMSKEDLEPLLNWLDKSKNPLLVELPSAIYQELQVDLKLPKIKLADQVDLVDLSVAIPDIVFDIRYATDNNFLGYAVYTMPACYLHREAAERLYAVQAELKSMQLGLKVFDGYRPLSVQQIMWDKIQDERYVANPAKHKGCHTRGTAVDLTLVDLEGRELEMPTDFDHFSERAHSQYPLVSPIAAKNRKLLQEVMVKHGFQIDHTEWWHFNLTGWKNDVCFPPLDLPLEQL